MKKRVISLLLVLCMLLSLMPMQALAAETGNAAGKQTENPFEDVKQGDWCYDAVQYSRLNGLFSGTEKNIFAPDGTMTRGMFLAVLGRMAGVDIAAYSGSSGFSDVPAEQYYAPYIKWAAKYGITSGTGDGEFSPDAYVSREQAAVFYVRYFEAFQVDYETGADITTVPADLDAVSPYARDAVLKLWKTGLLNGDGTNFSPAESATRAQAATICMRTDAAVETWYPEPGIPSTREKVELPKEQGPVAPTKPSGDSGDSGDSTRYYEVQFRLGSNQTVPGVTMPATAAYAEGTAIRSLPTPSKSGMIFLGWYYDADLTDDVKTGDTVQRNMTLYAKAAAGDEINELDTPNYVTVVDQPTTFTFKVSGGADENAVRAALSLTQVTVGNPVVNYGVASSGSRLWTITPELKKGLTYQAELKDDDFKFVLDAGEQSSSVRYLNILTAKPETTNASLNPRLKQLSRSADNVSIADTAFNGLLQINGQNLSRVNTTSGTFTYSGTTELGVGDTVAIVDGADLTDVTSNEGRVAYIKITGISGSSYTYEMADVEDVLFMPDILPVTAADDTDSIDNQITISAANLTKIMETAEAAALDVGDFIGFYTDIDSDGYKNESIASYGKITGFSISSDSYAITYTAADETDVDGALDVYYTTEQKEITLSESEKDAIKDEIESDLRSSGYLEEAAMYLSAVMLSSNNLEAAPEAAKISESLRALQSSVTAYGGGLMRAVSNENNVTMKVDPRNITLNAYTNLEHLSGKGLGVGVSVPFYININDTIKIVVTASFDEEVIFKTKISTDKIKKGILSYDYKLSTSFEIGSYTGVNFTANITSGSVQNRTMTEKLNGIMKNMKGYSNSGGTSGTDGDMETLADIYTKVMDNANDAWFDVLSTQLYDMSGDAFYHVFCYQVKMSFVVSANMCVSMGVSFNYTAQKRYDFTLQVKSRESTNKTVDLEEARFNFDFYVVGSLGIRAGLRLEMYVGLFSLGLDKIGITAEVGAYARLRGYFFYNLKWSSFSGKRTTYSGAMLIEVGIYLKITFVAQALSSDALTWNPTLYSNEWPLWSAGSRQNVYAFKSPGKELPVMVNVKSMSLPGDTFVMKYMDLKNGNTSTANKDDATESNFSIAFSNPHFEYNPATNTVTVEQVENLEEKTDMTITWKTAPMAFSAMPIQKVYHISFTSPADYRCIRFDSCGGSDVVALVAMAGGDVEWPANPVKQGYSFGGWFKERNYVTPYNAVTAMPAFDNAEHGITLYAKWIPNTDTGYTVRHYQENLSRGSDGSAYTLVDTDTEKTGTTGSPTAAEAKSYTGFTAKPIEQKAIQPDGSTVVEIYYDRNFYVLSFIYGTGCRFATIDERYKYGETIVAPLQRREGYALTDWTPAIPETVTESKNYTAVWTPKENKVFFNVGGGGGWFNMVETGSKVPAQPEPTRSDGYVFGGWYADASCISEWNFGTLVTGPMTLYARWNARVTFNSKDGSSVPDVNAPAGYRIAKPADPTRTNCDFLGWYKDEAYTTAWNFGSDTVTAPMTLYAKWKASEFTVRFNSRGGTSVDDAIVTTGQPVEEPAAAPTRENCIFAGWYKDEACTTAWNFSDNVTAPMTLYAKWTAAAGYHIVTFDTCGRGVTPNPIAVADGNTIANAPTSPTYKYCTFDGWYQDLNSFTKWVFADTAGQGDQIGYVYGDITLYAKWSDSVGLWVAGQKVVDVVAGNILTSDIANFGKVSYDKTTNTLTLNGANISFESANAIGVIQYNGNDPLTIKLIGTNTITNTYTGTGRATDKLYGIKSNSGFKFTGDGTLTVTNANNAGGDVGENIAIYCGETTTVPTLSLMGPTVKAYAGTGSISYGVLSRTSPTGNCSGNIHFTAGELYATGRTQAVRTSWVVDGNDGTSRLPILGDAAYNNTTPATPFAVMNGSAGDNELAG